MASRAEAMLANRKSAPKARAGKPATEVGSIHGFEDDDELVRLRAVRHSLAEVLEDPDTAAKDRPPLARAFMEVDARIVAAELSRAAVATKPHLAVVPFDAARFE